MIYISNDNDP